MGERGAVGNRYVRTGKNFLRDNGMGNAADWCKVDKSSIVRINRRAGELPSLLTAVRAKCLDCGAGRKKEVALCPVTSCSLWPWRFRSGKRAARIVLEERAKSSLLPADYWAEHLVAYTDQTYFQQEYGKTRS